MYVLFFHKMLYQIYQIRQMQHEITISKALISSRLLFDARILRLCSNLRHFIARAKVRIKNIAYISRSSGSLCGRATAGSLFPVVVRYQTIIITA